MNKRNYFEVEILKKGKRDDDDYNCEIGIVTSKFDFVNDDEDSKEL